MIRLSLAERLQSRAARALLSLPDAAQRLLAGGGPIVRDGNTLDAQVQHMLAITRRLGRGAFERQPVEQARREMDVNALVLAPRTGPFEQVVDAMFPGPGGEIPARIYRPAGLGRSAPALVFFHGGGWVVGSVASHDPVARYIAQEGRCVVISVDYRLGPEHRFPAAPDDALAAFRHVAARAGELGVDPRRIAVGGDSAGGNLSAVVSLDTRGDAVRPAFQWLVYPAVDLTMSFPSIVSLGEGFFLERLKMDWFIEHYLRGPADRTDPRASPWFAADVAGAPPAAVFTAGFDPLRDEGAAYARKLAAAGVPTTYVCHGSMFHGFMNTCGGMSNARGPVDAMIAALRVGLE